MQDEAGRLGLSFINFNKESQEAMAKKGIDALYNPRSGDIIIINKEILKKVKKTIPSRSVK
jgi:vacuolar-type H+-ATPase subunit F/Vma7